MHRYRSKASLCAASGAYLAFQPSVFEWSRQPSVWLDQPKAWLDAHAHAHAHALDAPRRGALEGVQLAGVRAAGPRVQGQLASAASLSGRPEMVISGRPEMAISGRPETAMHMRMHSQQPRPMGSRPIGSRPMHLHPGYRAQGTGPRPMHLHLPMQPRPMQPVFIHRTRTAVGEGGVGEGSVGVGGVGVGGVGEGGMGEGGVGEGGVGEGGVLLIRRRPASGRRTLPASFFTNASEFLHARHVPHSVAELENMPLREQACTCTCTCPCSCSCSCTCL